MYSNECFIVSKEYYQGIKPSNNHESNTFERKIKEQKEILMIDDIEDSSSDEYEEQDFIADHGRNITARKNSAVIFCEQDDTKSDIIVIDDG